MLLTDADGLSGADSGQDMKHLLVSSHRYLRVEKELVHFDEPDLFCVLLKSCRITLLNEDRVTLRNVVVAFFAAHQPIEYLHSSGLVH